MLNSIIYFEENCIKNFEELEDKFLREPTKFAEYIYGLTEELHRLGLIMIQEALEEMDQMLQKSGVRRKSWTVESHISKTLTTSLGDVNFKKTLFKNKETGECKYLLDHVLQLEPYQRLTEDAEAEMLKEAVQTSYQQGAEHTSLTSKVSRQTVKNKIHQLKFPPDDRIPEQKKRVDYLYLDADEDHVALQFREKKGDITKAENGIKNNGLITKLVYVYEGKENGDLQNERKVLVNPHYFCGVNNGEENLEFWDEIYAYLDRNYDLEHVKKIYLNADGGSWIKSGMRRIHGITYVLDGFHLEKYLLKLTSHIPKKKRAPVLEELRKTIRSKTKNDFRQLVEEQKKEMPKWRNLQKVNDAAEYILSHWSAARLRLKRKNGVLGSSTESHVSHILSDRMSSRPMGWSRTGAAKMSELRAYSFNGGDMLELVRFQKKELPEAAGLEQDILMSSQIILSEKNRHEQIGKYVESITHSIAIQKKKVVWFNPHIWGL